MLVEKRSAEFVIIHNYPVLENFRAIFMKRRKKIQGPIARLILIKFRFVYCDHVIINCMKFNGTASMSINIFLLSSS